ncbi:UNVERIFIED_CONTAM: Cellulose synthase-like protein G3 [Sesamum radiatum]|uniref:Cellulose synthase-like protein G3 n=1 Tax=Sesamum radiatum TaxID=300843 RepID=A0AAW2MES7_SESRA
MNTATMPGPTPPLHSLRPLRRRHFNRLFAAVYASAILSLFYHHILKLLHSTTLVSFFMSFLLFISDVVLAYMWSTTQASHMNPVHRQVFPENLQKVLDRKDFPAMDIFICTADPYKEPPINVVNTALSVMAYDYPTEKLSVYVSDDGGSELTMFAFMEAAKFGKQWVPFCRENDITDRCPNAFFTSNYALNPKTMEIKMMYESMKTKVEGAVERGKVNDEYISSEDERQILTQYRTKDFTRQNHPSVIQVLLNSKRDVDNRGRAMPNLIYVSREKSKSTPHHFKAGALNVLYKRLYRTHLIGMDGLNGPSYVGTGCFFLRRVFFGAPSSYIEPETPELAPDHIVNKPINSREVLSLAQHVAGCNYENRTNWGSKMGFRYGSLVEDYYTGYRLQCEGWQSIFCDPSRPAFLGSVPISFNDALNQNKRWYVGLLEMGFCRYSPLTFGIRAMGILMAQSYAYYAFSAIWSLPITVYAFLPSLALLQGIPIFPKVYEPWFYLYAFMFLAAYGQDCLDFILGQSTFQRWWSDQRMWLIRALSPFVFGTIEFVMKRLGLPTHEFVVTSKVMDAELSRRYDQGMFEFGVPSPMFVPLATAAILNLIAFLGGFVCLFEKKLW